MRGYPQYPDVSALQCPSATATLRHVAGATAGCGYVGTRAFAVDWMYAVGQRYPRGGTINTIEIYVTGAGGVNAKAIVGLYSATSASDQYPSALLGTSSAYDCTATGVKTWTPAGGIVLDRNTLYWYALLCNDAAITFRSVTNWFMYPTTGTDADLGYMYWGWRAAQAYGALPNPFTAGGTPYGDGAPNGSYNAPLFAVAWSA